jgi:undecaprenyl-phosphate galactose phosphotransferase/putative colanic acid biosynthesis UDP-glucose lipid carrier transferase
MNFISASGHRVQELHRTEIGRSSGFVSYRTVGLLTAITDAVLIVVASILGGSLYHLAVAGAIGRLEEFAAIGANSALVFVLLSEVRGLYRMALLTSRAKQMNGVIFCWVLALLANTALLFLFKAGDVFSRGSMVVFGFIGLGLLLGFRALIATKLAEALARGRIPGCDTIVLGDRSELVHSSSLQLLRKYGVREVGRFELENASADAGTLTAFDLATIDTAIAIAGTHGPRQILLALSWVAPRRCALICERLRALALPVYLVPDVNVDSILSQPTRQLGSAIAVEIQRAPLSRTELVIKRAIDLVLASAGLVIFLPLLLSTAAAIKLESRGPVIFRQRRRGFSGREFTIYKFRTMTVLEDGLTVRQARPDDERATRVGRILRATSIDELPQLINVVRGDMSLVGPRPHALAHDDEYCGLIETYAYRHHVKPGITGWAQVNGFRGETAELELMNQRVDLDLWYINNWSLWLDLRILLRTCVEIVRDPNAY